MLSDLKTFFLWLVLTFLIIGIFDSFYLKPNDNDEENQIIRPSYDHSLLAVLPGKQE